MAGSPFWAIVWLAAFVIHTPGQAAPVQPRAGAPADLALFGHLTSWNETGDDSLFSRKSAAPWTPHFANFGVEWDEPREIDEIRAAFEHTVPLEAIHPEYWVSLSSANPPGGGQGGWTLTDTPWNGSWKPVRGSARIENGTWVFRFGMPGADEESKSGNVNIPTANSRRTLKVRLRFDGMAVPSLTRFEVFGYPVWNAREVSIETGTEGKQSGPLSFDIYNGRITSARAEGNVTRLRVLYLEHFPGSNDGTVLTIHTPAASFGLGIDDLIQHKTIYVRDLGVFAADEIAGATFQRYMTSGRLRLGQDIISRVSKQPEQSLERAMSEVPALSMRDRSGRHANRYIPVGVFANREKYGVEFNGNLFISKRGSKAFPEEQARMQWSGDELSCRIGTGPIPDFREREHSATQSVADGYLPVILTDWTQNGLAFHEEAFATLLDAPLETWSIRGDEPSVLLAKLTVTNTSHSSHSAKVWLYLSPQENVALRDGVLTATGDREGPYAEPRLRAVLKTSVGQFENAALPVESEYQGSAAVWDQELGANQSATVTYALTFRTLHDDASIRRLQALDYGQERTKIVDYWAKLTGAGSRLHVPDEPFNRFYRAALQHILLSVQRDVPTGLYMAPCGTYDYNMFANETDIQVRLLDMRGLPELAAKFLEPFFALQGSKPFPGRFRETAPILHGIRIDPEHDYTQSGYNLNHGWTLWTAAEHYLFTRDQAWLRAHMPKMIKGADWIVSERRATMRRDENDQKVWEYGLLPPGQLEDNEEWQHWFAVNAYAYRGLRATSLAITGLDPVNGKRLEEEAAQYRQDIRAAAFRSMAALPAVPLRDGTWVPALATRTRIHGRDIGWIRNILYGPQVLIDCGVIAQDELAGSWVLRDLEDNLFMSPESFGVTEQDWFSRGGITLQPNLVNTPVIYLARDEIPEALRAFYNAFAASYYPDVSMFSEWEPSFGRSGGPFFKTSDEAAFLAWLRQILIREQNETLYMSSGAPRRWFRAGQRIEFIDAPTYFGNTSLTIESHSDRGYIDAVVDVPAAFRGKGIELRLRHPEGKTIARVEIDGHPWTRFDPSRDWISLPTTAGQKRVRAYF